MRKRAIAYTLPLALFLTVALSVWAVGQEVPRETGKFRQPDLVELVKLDPTVKLEIRYATPGKNQNRARFLRTPSYRRDFDAVEIVCSRSRPPSGTREAISQ